MFFIWGDWSRNIIGTSKKEGGEFLFFNAHLPDFPSFLTCRSLSLYGINNKKLSILKPTTILLA
jgi:hypothetical protein